MIASTISNGLGNQMFIYAMTRAMALRNMTDCAFNLRDGFFRDYYKRSLELTYLNVKLPQNRVSTFDYGSILCKVIRFLSRKVGRNIFRPAQLMVLESRPLHFEQNIKAMSCKDIYLEGYWQSEKYFNDYSDTIRDDFKINVELPQSVYSELARYLSYNRPLVFVGVRRYQECNGAWQEYICNRDYYEQAMLLARQQLSNPLFVVFSQDRTWCESNLKSEDCIIAEEKSGELSTISDLYLMTHCDHAIISVSSFYWWGAWLQPKSHNHVVISPDNFPNKDTVCDDWQVITT